MGRQRKKPDAKRINPAAMAPADAARLLSAAGPRAFLESDVARDIAAGAPTNKDGTLNLVAYTAWLAREACRAAEAGTA